MDRKFPIFLSCGHGSVFDIILKCINGIIMETISCRSATSKLTMENVPWHADVKAFSEALALKSEGEYEVACEHVHSCCVLLAKTEKFKIDGQWFTWIDYEKFHDLVC